jgi:hypothetical protein
MQAKQWACYYLVRHVSARGGEWERALDVLEKVAVGSGDYRVLDYSVTTLQNVLRSKAFQRRSDTIGIYVGNAVERLNAARNRTEVPAELQPPERVVVQIQGVAYAFPGFHCDYDWAHENRNPAFLKVHGWAARHAEFGDLEKTSALRVLEIGDGPVEFLEVDSRRPGPWLTVENDRREVVAAPHGWFVQGQNAEAGDLVEPVVGSSSAWHRSESTARWGFSPGEKYRVLAVEPYRAGLEDALLASRKKVEAARAAERAETIARFERERKAKEARQRAETVSTALRTIRTSFAEYSAAKREEARRDARLSLVRQGARLLPPLESVVARAVCDVVATCHRSSTSPRPEAVLRMQLGFVSRDLLPPEVNALFASPQPNAGDAYFSVNPWSAPYGGWMIPGAHSPWTGSLRWHRSWGWQSWPW